MIPVPEPLNVTTALKSWPGSPSHLEEIRRFLVRLEDSFLQEEDIASWESESYLSPDDFRKTDETQVSQAQY